MKYNYINDHNLPVVVTLTYQDLLVIHRMAKAALASSEQPTGLYRSDLVTLEREAREALNSVHESAQWNFPMVEDETSDE